MSKEPFSATLRRLRRCSDANEDADTATPPPAPAPLKRHNATLGVTTERSAPPAKRALIPMRVRRLLESQAEASDMSDDDDEDAVDSDDSLADFIEDDLAAPTRLPHSAAPGTTQDEPIAIDSDSEDDQPLVLHRSATPVPSVADATIDAIFQDAHLDADAALPDDRVVGHDGPRPPSPMQVPDEHGPADILAAAAAEPPNETNIDGRSTLLTIFWTFYPHYSPDDEASLPHGLPRGAAFTVFQQERCPKTGRYHLQGYTRFEKKMHFSTIRNVLAEWGIPNAHFQRTNADGEQAEHQCVDYCTKNFSRWFPDKQPYSFGEMKPSAGAERGRRTDLEKVAQALLEGRKYEDIVELFPKQAILHDRGIKSVEAVVATKNLRTTMREVDVTVLWGASDTGKTYRVRQIWHTLADVYVIQVGQHEHPFDDYKGQPVILFEEFGDGEAWNIDYMKQLLDKYPMQLACRYSNKWAAWTRVYICTQVTPGEIYASRPARDLKAFWRRITRCTKCLHWVEPAEPVDGPDSEDTPKPQY